MNKQQAMELELKNNKHDIEKCGIELMGLITDYKSFKEKSIVENLDAAS